MKKKLALAPYILLSAVLVLLLFLNLFFQSHWLDSDMAAEMIFSRLLAREGHLFATPDWYYSTEFRVLYTQLIMGPLFLICGDWHLIRLITNMLFYGLMLGSYFYMMKPLNIHRCRTILTSLFLLLPFSETMMTHMQMGNTYLSHVIILFLFYGMYLRLSLPAGTDAHAASARKPDRQRRLLPPAPGKRLLLLCFLLLGILCGISGVRYLLAMQGPLTLAAFIYLLCSQEVQSFRKAPSRILLRSACVSTAARFFFYSVLGAAASVTGYGINMLYVSRNYVFQTYDAISFIGVYQGRFLERFQNTLGSLLMLFGYIPDKSVISLRGIITIISFVLIALILFCVRKAQRYAQGCQRFTVLFFWTAFAFNTFFFVFTNSTLVPRYYITVFIFALPLIAVYFDKEPLAFDRWVAGLLFAGCLCLSTAKVVLSFITIDKNEDKYAVTEFLTENGYDFGVATYWNANIITELSNGEVELANIMDPEGLEYFTWSSPMKYYEEGYHEGEVFLLLTQEECAEYKDARAVKTGKPVYQDSAYTVYVYENMESLLSCR